MKESSDRNVIFRRAEADEIDEITRLYKQPMHTRFCPWNEYYPTEEDARHDLASGALYVITEEGKIIGVCTAVTENELGELPFWKEKNAREIARVTVEQDRRGRGAGFAMVHSLISLMKSEGARAIHLAVYVNNVPALKMYEKLGFTSVGKAEMYGNMYLLMELSARTGSEL